MVRRALTRQTRWYQNRCSTFKIKDFIVQKSFWKILEFWPLVTSILTWAKKWPKWFRNDFSRAFERRFPFCSTMRRSRDRRGGVQTPPPSRSWKIQRPSRARVKSKGKKSTLLYLLWRKRFWVESYSIGQLWTIRVKNCITYPSKGHLRSRGHQPSFANNFWAKKKIETWNWCHYVCFGQANRVICNMTHFRHHVTLAWLHLRSNFDLDLSKSL